MVQARAGLLRQLDDVPGAGDVGQLGRLGRRLEVVNGGEVEEVGALHELLVGLREAEHRLGDVTGQGHQALLFWKR